MRIKKFCLLALILFFTARSSVFSQPLFDSASKEIEIPLRALTNISKKSEHFSDIINSKSIATLNKLEKLERKYFRKLSRIDSSKANEYLRNSQNYYTQAREILKNPLDITKRKAGVYIPWIDSATTTLKYFEKLKNIGGIESGTKLKGIEETLGSIHGLQETLGKSKAITKLIDGRKKELIEKFQKVGMIKDIRKFQVTAYYHKAQMAEYKRMINEPDQLFANSIHLLQKIPAFNEFYSRNSILSQFVRAAPLNPQDPSYLQSLSGLQTRESISKVLQEKLGTENVPDPQQHFDQLIQSGQSEIGNYKSTVLSLLNQFSKDAKEIPNFKPQHTKSKTFLKRLEYGMNIQTRRATNIYPIGTDVGLSIGYKLNDKSVLGVGGNYSFNWGKDLKHIAISHKGVGVRSFIDWNIKWDIWLTGGYELNYTQMFQEFSQLKSFDVWQHSGLIGLSKSIPIDSKYLKFSKVQLLWDLLSYRQIPRTQPILLRVGYGF